jgi:hypothetical protein
MPKESDYIITINDEVRLRLRYRVSGNEVEAFTVQLELVIDDEWLPVVRYDCAHGVPHRDLLDLTGNIIAKEWLLGSLNDVLTSGTRELRVNWRYYVSRFSGRA